MVRTVYICPECDSVQLEPGLCFHLDPNGPVPGCQREETDVLTRNENFPATDAAMAYNSGYQRGHEDGERDGRLASYDEIYDRGLCEGQRLENQAYNRGYENGYAKGAQDLAEDNRGTLFHEGFQSGYQRGHDTGWKKGYGAVSEAGYAKGYEAGNNSCVIRHQSDDGSQEIWEYPDNAYASTRTNIRLKELEATVSALANRIGELENEAGSNRTGWLRQHEADILKLRDQVQELEEKD